MSISWELTWAKSCSLSTYVQDCKINSVMVFCYQNCSDLLLQKIVLVIKLKFEAEGQEFAQFLRSLEQFIQTVTVRTIFDNRMLFQLIARGL